MTSPLTSVSSKHMSKQLPPYIYRMIDHIYVSDTRSFVFRDHFDIVILSGFSNKEILTNCISTLQDYFNIDKWQINQPIIISDIISKLLQIRGVQSVVKLEIVNKQDPTGVTYSPYGYDIAGATRNGNIYPSMDPAIFEIRYPNTDIQGRVVTI